MENLGTRQRKCNYCGEEIPESNRRCPYCGSLIEVGANNGYQNGNSFQNIPGSTESAGDTRNTGDAGNAGFSENALNTGNTVNSEKPECAESTLNTGDTVLQVNRANNGIGCAGVHNTSPVINPAADIKSPAISNRTENTVNLPKYGNLGVNAVTWPKPIGNGLKVFLTVIFTIIPGIGQLAGVITAFVLMSSDNDPDRRSFGTALLIASLLMFVIACAVSFTAALTIPMLGE